MKQKLYAIVDLETTGGRASRDKVIEIAIVLHDGTKTLDTYSTLINPECYVPYGITQLTGITQDMVQDAPRFYEVARKVVEMTEGAIFVAHNVRFDYSFLREEFARLGYTYSRKNLCTVRLSRKAFPGLPSYSLGNLIRSLGIEVENRHRALDDALATAEILRRILNGEDNEQRVKEMVNLGVKEALLPKNFTLERIHALPEECGVYYFHNQKGDVVYVGKSINIKKRVAEHFANKTEKAGKLQQHVHDISFELTGSELVALLLESHEIKRLRPSINRAQRVRRFPFVIHTYENEAGYRCFEIAVVNAKNRSKYHVISEFPKLSHAKGRLNRARDEYELCAHLCNLQTGIGACFHYHIKQCHGACVGAEPPESYNQRAEEARGRLTTAFDKDFFILGQGRSPEEMSVVLVEEGNYRGFGYVEREEMNGQPEFLRDAIRPFPGNPETTRIIQRYLSKQNGVKVVPVTG
ncbi:MAG: GIY-YIG nuclease family protein [Lewinellaceae bacterium]|nr:GIY-YIG nuclease family protein [Lewinellaceae bacterium]MCB9287005.1 GIY-YIG nuclease family protein [Lewinellaceae bacterium]